MSLLYREIKRGIARLVFRINIRFIGNEKFDERDMSPPRCTVECSSAETVFRINIRPLGDKMLEIFENKFLIVFVIYCLPHVVRYHISSMFPDIFIGFCLLCGGQCGNRYRNISRLVFATAARQKNQGKTEKTRKEKFERRLHENVLSGLGFAENGNKMTLARWERHAK